MHVRSIAASILVFCASAIAAHATSMPVLTLASVSGDTYTYALDVPPHEDLIFGYNTGTITLTGLSGVTGVTIDLAGSSAFTATFTSSEVTLTNTKAGSISYDNAAFSTTDVVSPLFVITSTSTTEGMVNYSINANDNGSGQVGGPVGTVAAAPEPSSLLLLTTGFAGIGGLMRRRFAWSGAKPLR
jgi:hypothetical protein